MMMNLELMFQHFVDCAGLAIFALFVGLIGVCIILMLLIGGVAAASWIKPVPGDGQADWNADDRAVHIVCVNPVF